MTGRDRFGFTLDPSVGYARGTILGSPLDETRRLEHAWSLAGERARRHGPESLSVFTGSASELPLASTDLAAVCNDWIGSGLLREELAAAGVTHLGGGPGDACAVLPRTSVGLIAWLNVRARDRVALSIVPTDGKSHVSVHLGAELARAQVVELPIEQLRPSLFRDVEPSCVVVTTVTSNLEALSDSDIDLVVGMAHAHDVPVLLDEAYGARVRPILFGGRSSLDFGADVVLANSDKAGLGGPRASLVAGKPAVVTELCSWAAARGMDARAPIMAGVLRALQNFHPDNLRREVADARELANELRSLIGEAVQPGPLGATIGEEDLLDVLHKRGAGDQRLVVPCEATAGLAMILLNELGVITVNTHGPPGARVSLRFKPVHAQLERAGGAIAVAQAVDRAADCMADLIHHPDDLTALIHGAN